MKIKRAMLTCAAFALTSCLIAAEGAKTAPRKVASVKGLFPEDVKFEIGKAKVLRTGTDVTLIGTGQMVALCMEAADMLEKEGITADVIDMSTIKPLDTQAIVTSVSKTGCAVTAEEHSVIGGLGSAVSEFLSENMPCPVTRIGTRDTFGESGDPDELFKKYGLTAEDIREAAKRSIGMKE